MKYTSAQCEAIRDIEGDIELLACAGSGKTAVAEGRVVKCLMRPGVQPKNIVALTYCDAAADSLKRRIMRLVKEKLGDVVGLSDMFVGTIHSFGLRLLQQELYKFRKYTVLGDVQSRLLIASQPNRSGLTTATFATGRNAGRPLGIDDIPLYLETLDTIREELVDTSLLPQSLQQALELYTALLDDRHLLEYSRILSETHRALTDRSSPDHVRLQQHLADNLKFLIVDEYQDCNVLIEAIIGRLRSLGAQVCVVGDDDQQIYSWRGADIQNFLGFTRRYPGARVRRLEKNFRSTSGVVSSARAIAERNAPFRMPKRMESASHLQFSSGDLLALSFQTPDEEAEWIAQKIIRLRGTPFQDAPDSPRRGLSWSDCAVLLRSVRIDAAPIVAALRAANIPYLVKGMAGLFDAPENEAVAVSFEMLAGSGKTADDVADAWRRADLGLTDQEIEAGIAFLIAMRDWDDAAQGVCCLQRVLLSLLSALSLHEERIGGGRGELVMINLGKISRAIVDFQAICFRMPALRKFVTFVAWLRTEATNAYDELIDDTAGSLPDAVVVATAHASKGLEWPCVFVPALQDGRFPSAARFYGSKRWSVLPRRLVPDNARYDGSLADERRLYYVALTRAQKFLYCTWSPSSENPNLNAASPFFREFAADPHVLRREPIVAPSVKIEPQPKTRDMRRVISFTALKYLHECPYLYQLRCAYGFSPPVAPELGYGKSLHDGSAEIHLRALSGEIVTKEDIDEIVVRHLSLPYAGKKTKERMRVKAGQILSGYLDRSGSRLSRVIYSEQPVEYSTDDVTVRGRIDLAEAEEDGEVVIDQKTSEKAGNADSSRLQVGVYSLGHRALTGRPPRYAEIQQMGLGGANLREPVTEQTLTEVEGVIRRAGETLRSGCFPRLRTWGKTCERCDMAEICANKVNRAVEMAA